MTLPPGQRRIDGFPRFSAHLSQAAPAVPAVPAIEICGDAMTPLTVKIRRLAELPRREVIADFQCVAGWTATDLQ